HSLTRLQSSSTPACLAPESPANLPATGTAARSTSWPLAQICSYILLATCSAPQQKAVDHPISSSLLLYSPTESTIPKNLHAAPVHRCLDRAGSILCRSLVGPAIQVTSRRQDRCHRNRSAGQARQRKC